MSSSELFPLALLNNTDNDTLSSNDRYSISETTLSVPGLMGDAISEGLSGVTGYFYDGLNGGFKFNMSSLLNVDQTIQKPPSYNINNHTSKLGQIDDQSNFTLEFDPANALLFTNPDQRTGTYVTLEAPNAAIQKFANFNNNNNFYYGAQKNPFIGETKGLGINTEFKIGKFNTVLGYHNSEFEGENLQSDLKTDTLAATFEIDTI